MYLFPLFFNPEGIIDPQGVLEHRLLSGTKQVDVQGNIQYQLENATNAIQENRAESSTNEIPTVIKPAEPTQKIERLMQVQRIQTSTKAPIQPPATTINSPWSENTQGDSLANLEQRVFFNEGGSDQSNGVNQNTIVDSTAGQSLSNHVGTPFTSPGQTNTLSPLENSKNIFVPLNLPVTSEKPTTPSSDMPSLSMLQFDSNPSPNDNVNALQSPNREQNAASLTGAVFGVQESSTQESRTVNTPTSSIPDFQSDNLPSISTLGNEPRIVSQEGSVVGVDGRPIKSSLTDITSDGTRARVAQNLINGPDGHMVAKVERIGADGQRKVSFESPSKNIWPESKSIGSKDSVRFDSQGRPLIKVESKKQRPAGPVRTMFGPNGEKIEISSHKEVNPDGSQYKEQEQQKIVSADGSHVSESSKIKSLSPDTAGVTDIKRQEIAERNRLHIKETENQKILKPESLEIKKRNREETHRPDVAHFKEEQDRMTVDVQGTSRFHKSQHQELIGPNRSAFSSSFSSKTVFAPRIFKTTSNSGNVRDTTTQRVNLNDIGMDINNIQPSNPFGGIQAMSDISPDGPHSMFPVPPTDPPNPIFQSVQERVRNSAAELNPNSNLRNDNNNWRNSPSEPRTRETFGASHSQNNAWREQRNFNAPDSRNNQESRRFNERQRVNRGEMRTSGQRGNFQPQMPLQQRRARNQPQGERARNIQQNNFEHQNVFQPEHIVEIHNPVGQQWFIPPQQHIVQTEGPPQGFINHEPSIETQQGMNVPFFGSSPWNPAMIPNTVQNVMQPVQFFRSKRKKRQLPPPPPSFDDIDFSRAVTTKNPSPTLPQVNNKKNNNMLSSSATGTQGSMPFKSTNLGSTSNFGSQGSGGFASRLNPAMQNNNMGPNSRPVSSSLSGQGSNAFSSRMAPPPPMGVASSSQGNRLTARMTPPASMGVAPPTPPTMGGPSTNLERSSSISNQRMSARMIPPPPMNMGDSRNSVGMSSSNQQSSSTSGTKPALRMSSAIRPESSPINNQRGTQMPSRMTARMSPPSMTQSQRTFGSPSMINSQGTGMQMNAKSGPSRTGDFSFLLEVYVVLDYGSESFG